MRHARRPAARHAVPRHERAVELHTQAPVAAPPRRTRAVARAAQPDQARSFRPRGRPVTIAFGVSLVVVLLAAAARAYGGASVVLVAVVLLTGLLFWVAASSMWLSLHAWQTPQNMEDVGFPISQQPQLSFSLIIPIRGETYAVVSPTINALARQAHPDFELVVVVSGDDDSETREAVQRVRQDLAGRGLSGLMKLVHVTGEDKNKPKALMAALGACTGEIIGVFDAESIAADGILNHVDTAFVESGADVVQCGVQLMNYQDSWYSLQNVLEYYKWFKSRLHTHARKGFIPLGGNTVFMRRAVLDELGGWDVLNLTEDCDLGVRASAVGKTVRVAYDPRLATREETPDRVKVLYRQRARWMQGFLQTYLKGDWRRLPLLRQRMLARYTLLMPFVQCLCGLLIPVSAAAFLFVKLPVLIALATCVPLVPAAMTLMADMVALHDFGKDYGLKVGLRHYLRLCWGYFPYQLILSAAAVKAATDQLRGKNTWYKTAHSGSHHKVAVASGAVT